MEEWPLQLVTTKWLNSICAMPYAFISIHLAPWYVI